MSPDVQAPIIPPAPLDSAGKIAAVRARLGRLPAVTVVMPLRNEEHYVAACLDSLLANDYPRELVTFVLVDGLSTDATPHILAEYAAKHPNFRILQNPHRIVPSSLNLAIKEATGEIIVRVDCHALFDSDYVVSCVERLVCSGATSVGGVQRAVGTDYVSQAIAIATTSRFGTGDAKFRYSNKEEYVDTVYLGCWWRTRLIEVGAFNEDFVVNQDYELNYRIRKSGGRILLSPTIKCRYFVRPTLRKLAKQYFRYGLWKIHTLTYHPQSLRWRQMAPPLLVLALLVAFIAGAALHPVWFLIPCLYLAAAMVAGVKAAGANRRYLPLLPWVFVLLHLSWGVGFWLGIPKFGVPGLAKPKDALTA